MLRDLTQMRVVVACSLGALLVIGGRLQAQTITTGVLEGVVTDRNTLPMSDVLVTVSPLAGGAARATMSDHEGRYRFTLMPAGRYTVSVEKLGYRPVIIEDITVPANARTPLTVSLAEAPPPVEQAERLRFEGAATGSRAGASQLLSLFALDRVAWQERELTELAKLSSASSTSLEVEGLPQWLSMVRVDGIPYAAARHPELAWNHERGLAVPLSALSLAELVTGEADAEWGGAAGGTLSTATRRGGNTFETQAFGAWSGSSLRSSELFESADLSSSSMWGGILLDGAIVRDTAHIMVALEARRIERPLPSVWNLPTATADALIAAGNARGADLSAYTAPYTFETTVLSGIGRFDWQLGNQQHLSVRAALGTVSPGASGYELAAVAQPALTGSARDLLLSGALTSTIGASWAHELRVGFSSSMVEHTADDADDALLPATRLVSGARVGSTPRMFGEFRRSDLTAEQSLQIPAGNHQVKLGLGVGLALHDATYEGTVAEFTFGDSAQLAQAQGVYIETEQASPEVDFSTLNVSGYVQDTWQAGPGLQVIAGVRVDMETLPHDDVAADASWLAVSGLDNTDFESKAISVSPRLGMIWDAGSNVVVRVNAGRYASPIDPSVLAELLAGDGDLTVRRGSGALGAWPGAPAGSGLSSATRLALLGPDFRGAQSDRVSVGFSSRLGSLGTLHLSGAFRKTSSLARRSDLNLLADPVAEDQYGRPIYGTLSQAGQLLSAGVSNRRFSAYDAVSGITADGTSEYRGVTVALETPADRSVSAFASYTYSQTTDDWPARRGSRLEMQQAPFPDQAADDWLDGTSDYDLPHRLVGGLQFRPQIALQPSITAIYRMQSGYPFTPGFRDGVDANGDGSDTNDPAYVDANLAGMSEVTGNWSCLGGQTDQFAERNSCRAQDTHELDVRVELTLLQSSRTSARIFAEGVNLMDARFDEPDRALVLVDASRTLQFNQAQGTVDVPLVANPNFGKPLLQRGSGRLLRVGMQVNF